MKKIAFMFAAAAMFVACGSSEQKPAAEVVEAPVEVVEEVAEYVLTAEDSIAAKAAVAELGIAEDAENYAAAVDSVLNDIKANAQNVVEEVAETVEEVAEPAAE